MKLTIGGAAVALVGTSRLAGAADVALESPGLTLRSARADVEVDGTVLMIRPLPD